ncbi:GIY-YIG nuclease family protein [Lutibacter sp.]
MVYVYVLYSEKYNRKYTGMTMDVEKRLREHNTGQNRSTKAYIPWKVVFKEEFKIRLEARAREKYLKSGVGRDFIKSLLF